MGADHDGSGGPGRDRISAAWKTSRESGSDQSAGHVGLYGSVGRALEDQNQVPAAAPGFGEPEPAEIRPLQSRYLGRILARWRTVRETHEGGFQNDLSRLRLFL